MYTVRAYTQCSNEQKRLDILVNKTREEVARDYVTRQEIEQDLKDWWER